jgi:cell division protein FtsZ
MGKAMMGTGEASGDRRAVLAAEAAIANPLLDDVSMKGAKGLLISITGGPDMMLYELDEAATRIREEVDPEANIILGATQDPSLEGIMRVSVVATGIDQAVVPQAAPSQNDMRLAELTARIRQQNASMVARPAPTPVVAPTPIAAFVREPEPVAPAPAPILAESVPAESAEPEAAIELEIAAAFTASAPQRPEPAAEVNDVTLRPLAPRPSLFPELPVEQPAPAAMEAAPQPDAFIPPPAERGVVRPPRMPRVEELPMPARNQIAAAREAQPEPADKKRMSLLQRLAAVGLGRREEEAEAPAAPRVVEPRAPMPAARPAQAGPAPEAHRRPPAPAYRPAQGQLDAQGRASPPKALDDDQLEIPAFLRRQST